MTTNYLFKNCTLAEKKLTREYCEQKLPSIQKLLKTIDPKAVRLDIHAERLPKKHAYKITFILHLPDEKLYAFEDDHTLSEAIDLAKDKLVFQLQRQHERLKKQKKRRGKDVSAQLESLPRVSGRGGKKQTLSKQEFFDIALPSVDDLRPHLEREVGYAYMEEELDPDSVTAESILDEALVHAYEHLRADPLDLSIVQSYLYQEVFSLLRRECERQRSEQTERVSLNSDANRFVQDKTFATPVEEKIDPWQPDDDLKFESMAREEEWFNPEENLSREEIKEQLLEVLQGLPSLWRQTLFLHVVDSLSPVEIARLQNRSISDVERDIRFAKEYLREKLN